MCTCLWRTTIGREPIRTSDACLSQELTWRSPSANSPDFCDTDTGFPVGFNPSEVANPRSYDAVAHNSDIDVRRTIRGERQLSHLARPRRDRPATRGGRLPGGIHGVRALGVSKLDVGTLVSSQTVTLAVAVVGIGAALFIYGSRSREQEVEQR